jgi:SAM-dependent methyltransferase
MADRAPSLWQTATRRWRETAAATSGWRATRDLASDLWEFVRESTPERRRARYGDLDYDFESGADTTAANVGWRTRLLAALAGAPYQPSEPQLFHEMLRALPGELSGFTFVDVGSGKGRALLLAAEYPFVRIVGVELVPELHAIAVANIEKWREKNGARAIASRIGDARDFEIPQGPLVVYLFNPLPEAALARFMARLEESLRAAPRPMFLIYHNPILEKVVAGSTSFEKFSGTHQYALYRAKL